MPSAMTYANMTCLTIAARGTALTALTLSLTLAGCLPGLELHPGLGGDAAGGDDVADDDGGDGGDSDPECGDDQCNGGETCSSCAADCGACCGNGRIDLGEECDTLIASGPGHCPALAECSDGIACTADTLTGAACTTKCEHVTITEPVASDGCCPANATSATDNDCLSPAPVRTEAWPSGHLLPRTDKATLRLATDIAAQCRFAASAGVAYDAMTSAFTSSNGGTKHTAALVGLLNATSYTYYVRCRSEAGSANVDDYAISFDVAALPMPIYRSVGPLALAALANEANGPVTIVDWRATFNAALPAKVGVGDVLQYDTSGDVTPDAIAIVYGRVSDTELVVRRPDGGVPTPVAASGHWALRRAYTSLAAAEAGTENSGIDATLVDFDTWVGGKDLVAADEVWNIACYGDSIDDTAVEIAGWTTGAGNYLRIFVPKLASEVGASQRHAGVWNDARYNMRVQTTDSLVSITGASFVRIEGLQFHKDLTQSVSEDVISVAGAGIAASSEVVIRDNIISATISADPMDLAGVGNWAAGSVWVMNNIIYDITRPANSLSGISNGGTGTVYAYNNTVVDCRYGLRVKPGSAGTIVAVNNLVQGAATGYVTGASFGAASSNNLSNANDAPGANPLNGKSVTFVNAGSDNFHLASGDTQAHDAGYSLEGISKYSCESDIDGDARSGAWDVGADEL